MAQSVRATGPSKEGIPMTDRPKIEGSAEEPVGQCKVVALPQGGSYKFAIVDSTGRCWARSNNESVATKWAEQLTNNKRIEVFP